MAMPAQAVQLGSASSQFKEDYAACRFSESEAAKVTEIRWIVEMVLWNSDPHRVEALLPPVSVLNIPV